MDTQIRAELTEFIVTNYLFGDVTQAPRDDDALVEEGIIDSTGILELIEFLESHFGIEVSEAETVPQNLGSISSLTEFVMSKRSVREPDPLGSGVRVIGTRPAHAGPQRDLPGRRWREGMTDGREVLARTPATTCWRMLRRTSVALVEAGERYTYGQLRSAAGRLAAELAALDLPPGSRVGVLGPNSFFWVAAYLAVMKLNHVAVPFSDKLTPDDVRRNAGIAGCAAVFADRRALRRFSAAFGDGLAVLTDEALRSGREPYWPRRCPGRPGRGRRPHVHVRDDLPAEGRAGDAWQHPGEHRFDHHVSGAAQRRPGPGHPPVLLLLRRLAPAYAPAAWRPRRPLQLVRLPGDGPRPARAGGVHRSRRRALVVPAAAAGQHVRAAGAAVAAAHPASWRKAPAGAHRGAAGGQARSEVVRHVRPDGGHRAAVVPPAGQASARSPAPSARASPASNCGC